MSNNERPIPKHECNDTRYVTCPYCGYEDLNSWEIELGDGESQEYDCKKCEWNFCIEAEVIRTFTSYVD